jgi:hypothetical protein
LVGVKSRLLGNRRLWPMMGGREVGDFAGGRFQA